MLRPLSPSVRDSLEMATSRYQSHVGQAEEFLAARGIDLELARDFRLGVVVDPIPGHGMVAGRLAIPSLGRTGAVSSLRFRSLDDGKPKYLGLPGVALRLFNVRSLFDAGESIHITEGEIDAISLAACGLHAVGVPGVKAWPEPDKKTGRYSHHHKLFAGFSRVYVWGDGDDPGRDFAERIEKEIDQAVVVSMPEGMDVNAILVEQGREALLSMAV